MSEIEIPKEIEELLDQACSHPVDLVAPMKRSLSQRAMEVLKINGLGFDVNWDVVTESMSRCAQRVVAEGTLVNKLKLFARLDYTWLRAQLQFTSMILPSAEKVKAYQSRYKEVQEWYETIMELLMGNVLSILGGSPEQLAVLLTDILETEIARAEGRLVKDSEIEEMVKEYLEEVNDE